MQAYEIQGAFGLEKLKRVERPDLSPGPGELVLRCEATSLNFRDLLMVRGHYNPKQALPLIPCSDGAGVVEAVGSGVSNVSVGDRVLAAFCQGWHSGAPTRDKCRPTSLGGPLDGCLASHVLLKADCVEQIPDWMSFEQAATLPCAALTAWSALCVESTLNAGDRILVLGTGGVSLFALQIARLHGAEVMITSSSDEKLERAKALGASHCVNYRQDEKWGKAARVWSGGAGVDHVVEVGGAGTLAQSVQATRMGGTVSVIGVLSGASEAFDVRPVLMGQIKLQGVLVGHQEALASMLRAFDANRVEPVIDKVFPFSQAVQAFEHMASGSHFGKIVIRTQE